MRLFAQLTVLLPYNWPLFTLFVFRAVGLNPPLMCQGTGSVNSDSFAI